MKLKSMGHEKTLSGNSARIPTLKVYHKSLDLAQAQRELRITAVILVLSILANMIMFIRIDQLQSKLDEVTETDTQQILEPIEQTFPTATAIDKPTYETMPICSTTSTFKSWMDYNMITSHSSRQWKLQQTASTDEYGFRKVGDYYMVAMSIMYGPVGTKYSLTFSGGQSMDIIIGEVKGNTSCSHPDGSMLEMIVDSNRMPSNVKRSGNYNSMIEGTIIEIRVVKE